MREKAPLPKDVIALGVNGIRKIWHDKKMRGRGVTEDRAKTLVEAAHNSVGLDGGQLGNLVVVVTECSTQLPLPVLLVDKSCVHANFNTSVLHLTLI